MRAEKDTGQLTTNPHLLAARLIKQGGSITHHDINVVLASQGHSITADELAELKKVPYTVYKFPLVGPALLTFSQLYPNRLRFGQGPWGGMYINNLTNVFYVGSSYNLGERLRDY